MTILPGAARRSGSVAEVKMHVGRALALLAVAAVALLFASAPLLALDPSLAVSQYAHTAWTVRDGFSLNGVFAMAQTPDGYLWLGNGS